MASLGSAADGLLVIPTEERERRLLAFYRARGERYLPLEDALYELRISPEGADVVLLPFRSPEAAKRLCLAFEVAARRHEVAEKSRGRFRSV